jgi:hypothetical protein
MAYSSIFSNKQKVTVLNPKKEENFFSDLESFEDIKPIETYTNQTQGEISVGLSNPILVYAGESNPITGRDIVERASSFLPDSVARCFISDSQYLSLFQASIEDMLVLNGEQKYNNFIAKIDIKLEPGVSKYKLPNNFDQPINLWSQKDNRWYTQFKKFQYLSREGWTSNFSPYTYTTEGGSILINFPGEEHRNECGHCKKCDSCKIIEGTLQLEYYYLPSVPKSLDEPLWWFWNHPAAVRYLVEILIEKITIKNGGTERSPYKENFRKALLTYDNNLYPVDSSVKINKRLFKFK